MIAIIKGDIIASRALRNQNLWLQPLKELLGQWGKSPLDWEVVWGDFFQLEIANAEEALQKAFQIKALLKKIADEGSSKKMGSIDVRLAIGIGEKTFSGKRISESNGPAFVYAGEQFEELKREKINLALQSLWADFDEEMNLYLRLAGLFMDNWTVSSAEIVDLVLQHPEATQKELGTLLNIKQSAVSGRWNRAHVDEVLQVEQIFRQKLKQQKP